MGWIRVDDHFNEHPKLAQVGPLGWGMWVAGLAYCNRNLTDGFIPRAAALSLGCFEFELGDECYELSVTCGMAGTDLTPEWVINMLLSAGLWEPVKGGYRIHDYHDYQPTKERVMAERKAKTIRQERWRNGRKDASVDASTNGATDSARDGTGDAGVDGDVGALVCPAPNPNPNPKKNVNTNAELRSAVIECFAYWQERCRHPQAQLDAKRQRNIEGRLKDRQRHHSGDLPRAILDIRQAIDGAALAAFVDERGKRHDDIELICRNVAKLEDFMARATAKPPLRMVSPLHTSRETTPEAQARIDQRLAELRAADEEAS